MRGPPQVGDELGGYRIHSHVARGGMAFVYLAEDVRMGRTVALKVLDAELGEDEDFRQRFLRESRAAGSIDHPNVIPVYDAGEADGRLYMAMRHVEGRDLRALLRAEGPLDVERSASIVAQVAGALAATHRHDLIHRDVKPANILLVPRPSEDGLDHVYLSDFGLAKHAETTAGLTRTGVFMGTVDYVAPEQIKGLPVDGRTDIYALGCVLYECLTGVVPFRRDEPLATLDAHVNDDPPLVSDVRPGTPASLDKVAARAMAKAPGDRHADCDELARELRAAARAAASGEALDADRRLGNTVATPPAAAAPTPPPAAPPEAAPSAPPSEAAPVAPPPAAPEPRRSPRRARLLVGGAVAALLAAGLLFVVLAGEGDDEPDRSPSENAAPAPPVETGPWRAVADVPTARQQVASAVVDGRVWMIGGLTSEGTATDRVDVYDPAIDTWNAAPKLPAPLHHAMAVTYKGELVVVGGWQPRGANLTAVVSGDVLALRDGRWVKLPGLRQPRVGGAAAVADGKLVVAAGQARGELVAATEVFDGERWRAGEDIPTPREHVAAAATGDAVYVVGGRNLSADHNSAALERYDVADDRWTKLEDMPVPSGGLGAAIVDGRLVAVGGEEPTKLIPAVQAFDLRAERWSEAGAMDPPRHGMAVVAIGPTVYALGGALAPGHLRSTTKSEALELS